MVMVRAYKKIEIVWALQVDDINTIRLVDQKWILIANIYEFSTRYIVIFWSK